MIINYGNMKSDYKDAIKDRIKESKREDIEILIDDYFGIGLDVAEGILTRLGIRGKMINDEKDSLFHIDGIAEEDLGEDMDEALYLTLSMDDIIDQIDFYNEEGCPKTIDVTVDMLYIRNMVYDFLNERLHQTIDLPDTPDGVVLSFEFKSFE